MKKSGMLRSSAIIALAVLLSVHMLLELMMGYVFRELAPPIVIYVVLLSLLLSAAAFRYGRNAAGAQRTVSWVLAALLAGMVLHVGVDLLTQGSHSHNGKLICAFCGRETVSYYVLPLGVAAIIGSALRIRKTVGTPEKIRIWGNLLVLGAMVGHLAVLIAGSFPEWSVDNASIVFYYIPLLVAWNCIVLFGTKVSESVGS